MKLLEDIILKDSIEIRTTPEKIFNFLVNLVDDQSYRVWHSKDHVSLRWIKGRPWEEGSVVYAEEYIHGKLHKLKFLISKVVTNKTIEYVPVSKLLRIYFPKNTFNIEQKGDISVFTATAYMRIGRLVKTFAKKKLKQGISSIKQHMKEEGENLKQILEEERSNPINSNQPNS